MRLRAVHVQSVGVDLVPALEAQGYDGEAIVASGGRGLPARRRRCADSRRPRARPCSPCPRC